MIIWKEYNHIEHRALFKVMAVNNIARVSSFNKQRNKYVRKENAFNTVNADVFISALERLL